MFNFGTSEECEILCWLKKLSFVDKFSIRTEKRLYCLQMLGLEVAQCLVEWVESYFLCLSPGQFLAVCWISCQMCHNSGAAKTFFRGNIYCKLLSCDG